MNEPLPTLLLLRLGEKTHGLDSRMSTGKGVWETIGERMPARRPITRVNEEQWLRPLTRVATESGGAADRQHCC